MSVPARSPASPPERLLYSVEEAAVLLGIGRTFMFHLVATGEIASLKIGTRRKIPRDAVDAYIDRLRAEQPAVRERAANGPAQSRREASSTVTAHEKNVQ